MVALICGGEEGGGGRPFHQVSGRRGARGQQATVRLAGAVGWISVGAPAPATGCQSALRGYSRVCVRVRACVSVRAVCSDSQRKMAPVGGEMLPQPFLEPESVPKPTDRGKDVATLRAWVNTQPHLPPLSDDHLILFLHSCNYALDRTQKTIDSYFTTRTNETYLFSKKDPGSGDLKYVFGVAELVACPERTKEGYGVLLYRLTDFDPSHVDFLQGMKSFFAFNDVRLSEDGVIPGYVVVFDMRGITLSHLGVVTLSGIRKFMHYIQECHPCRLKAIHVINTVKWFDKILALIKPFVKSELLQMLSMHGEDLTSMFKTIPKSVLPSDYGGNAASCKELHDAHVKLMVDKYTLWLKQEETLRVDEKKRPDKCKAAKFNTMEGSFRSLAID